jgi:hypothetical protein
MDKIDRINTEEEREEATREAAALLISNLPYPAHPVHPV